MVNGQISGSPVMLSSIVFSQEKRRWPIVATVTSIILSFQTGTQEKKRILARHETLNSRIKRFACMRERFRHPLYLHPRLFHAVVNLTQLMIENSEPLFPIDVFNGN